MEKYILVKMDSKISYLDDFFKGLLGSNIEISYISDVMAVKYTFDNDMEIREALEAFIIDAMQMLKIVISIPGDKYLDKFAEYLNNPNLKSSLYDVHELIFELTLLGEKKGLAQIITTKQVDETIITFIECNMNTSAAAKRMYMHRNTLINKLDKFKEETGYDVRDFKDAYVIYTLFNK